MKFALFQKDANLAGGSSAEVQTVESLLERMEAASEAADIAVKKAEATARKAEAAASKAEALVKQVEMMLEQVGHVAEQKHVLPTSAAPIVRGEAKNIQYSETISPAEKDVSDSGIPLVAPFIVQEDNDSD